MPSLKIPGYGLTTDGPLVVGVDPGGAELLRVGGALRVTHTAQPMSLENNAAAGPVSFLQLLRNGVTAGYIGADASSNPTINRGDGGVAITVNRLTGAAIVGTDPGGSEALRVGGTARASTLELYTGVLTLGGIAAGIRVDSNLTPRVKGRDLTLANNAVAPALQDGLEGWLYVGSDDHEGALFFIRGSTHTLTKIHESAAGVFTVTPTNAGTINVYWDAGNSRYSIENKRGGSRIITLTFVGQ